MNDNHQIFTVELTGSFAATCIKTGMKNDQSNRCKAGTTRSPIPALARKMIAEGYNPAATMHVVRKRDDGTFMPISKADSTIETWAERDCVESEKRSVRIGRFNPPPAARDAITLPKAA
ncbi:hypothetical protein QD336_00050 [Rhizobium sp. BR 250]